MMLKRYIGNLICSLHYNDVKASLAYLNITIMKIIFDIIWYLVSLSR